MEPYLKPPRTTLQPWWNPRWNPGGTLVKPSSNLWNPGGTLLEPYLKPPRPPRSLEPWWNPGGTLVKPSSNLQKNGWNPDGTLVEPYLKPLVEPWWNPGGTPGGTLVEPLVEHGGTLAQGRPEPPRSLSGLRPQSFQLLGKKGYPYST